MNSPRNKNLPSSALGDGPQQMSPIPDASARPASVTGPLDGLSVADFTLAMAGPFAAQKLGDLGANVYKIEPTGIGEWHRTRPAANAWVNKLNSSFLAFNRNKRSLAVDLKTDEGRRIVHQLIERCDVAMSNFRPGVAERLQVDYESLRSRNPGIVYCSMSGYGESGPYRQYPGQDLVLQGYSGALWNTGKIGDPPHPIAVYVADATASHLAVEGVLAALLFRERTGIGQKVEVNMLNGMVDLQAQELSVFLTGGVKPRRTHEPLAHVLLTAPYGVYRTKDGWMTLSIGPIPVVGEVLDDDRLRAMTDWGDGMTHRDEIFRIVAEHLVSRTTSEWLERFAKVDYWAGPVYDYDDLVNDPQVAHNRMIIEMEHPTEGTLRLTGIPIDFSASPGTIRRHQPLVGEQTPEILGELGYEARAIQDLIERGIVQHEAP